MALEATSSREAELVRVLSGVPFLNGIPEEELAELANASEVRSFFGGDSVVNQGQFGHSMFVLLSGAVFIRASGEDGLELNLGRLAVPGDFFGEIGLLGRGVRAATVICEGPCEFLEIQKNRFALLARRHEEAQAELVKYYHARSLATYTRLHRHLGLLDKDSLKHLTANAVMRKFNRDDCIVRAGEATDHVLLVKDGLLKMVRAGNDGKLSILAYFNSHDIIGAHDGPSRTYDLIALGHAEIIFLPRSEFKKLAESAPDVFSRFSKDDMHRQSMMEGASATVFGAAQAFLQEGVEVESLLVINLDRCVRCGNCVRACHARHKYTRLDRRGPIFRRRKAVQSKIHEHLLIPSSCRHCRDPECMIGCPTGAIQRFPDGDVDINDNCIGCDNCARKCPYGNITMRPLEESEMEGKEGITKKAIKCNLCRGYEYSNCVHECPRGAVLRVDPLRYFDELSSVMEPEQVQALEWQREAASALGSQDSKQRIAPRSTVFVWVSLALLVIASSLVIAGYALSSEPVRGGSFLGLVFGVGAAASVFFAMFLGARKRIRNTSLGPLEVWTQFHMVAGLFGFLAALAHSGFAVTGLFTTMLMVVFAFEVVSGVLGQAIYMIVPRVLTALERHGLAKLVEDLLSEEIEIRDSIHELTANSSPELERLAKVTAPKKAGGVWSRFSTRYDPELREEEIRASVSTEELSELEQAVAYRIIKDVCRLADVKAQLTLHRGLKYWLVFHLASAAALFVFLIFHILSVLTLI